MATITTLAATQDMLRLLVTGAGGEGVDSVLVTQATLVGECAAGPLKALLTAPFTEPPPGPGHAVWTDMHKDARLSVNLNGYGAVGGLTPSVDNGYQFIIEAEVNKLNLQCDSASDMICELRFNHSAVR